MVQRSTGPLVWDVNRLRIATDSAGVALWSWNVHTDEIALDARAHAMWGVPVDDGVVTFTELSSRIHPEDLDRVRAAFTATREMEGEYELDFRIMHGRDVRWISARGRGEDEGIAGGVTFGIFLDVSERKMAEEAREMLAGEMSHRVLNLFAIAMALTRITAQTAATPRDMANDLTQRLHALARAHELVRPTLAEQKKATPLAGLLAVLLDAYDDGGTIGDRIRVRVPDIMVGEGSITTMALVVHELATNSIKYGSLSVPTGRIEVTCTDEDEAVVMVWREEGGPPVNVARGQAGFGSKLVNRTITGQLGGTIAFDWPVGGVVVTLRMSKARLGV
jgi:two-component sensor histidine kinase